MTEDDIIKHRRASWDEVPELTEEQKQLKIEAFGFDKLPVRARDLLGAWAGPEGGQEPAGDDFPCCAGGNDTHVIPEAQTANSDPLHAHDFWLSGSTLVCNCGVSRWRGGDR